MLKKIMNTLVFKSKNQKESLGGLNDDKFKKWILENSSMDEFGDVTYFTCLKMLSETVGKLPIHLYQENENSTSRINDLDVINIVRNKPNPYMNGTMFWSTVEMNRQHFGNAFVWIRRLGTQVESLWIMQSQHVEIVIDDIGTFGTVGALWYRYNDPDSGELYLFSSNEVMHFKTSTTLDGISGISVRDKLSAMIEGSKASQDFMSSLYKQGLTSRAVLQFTSDLDEVAKKRLLNGLNKFATGASNAGSIIPIPLGMTLTPLNIKLTDAQFSELRLLNTRSIAAAFGVKPNQLNDYQNSNYSNSEMQQLSFYVDTLLFIVKQYEEEILNKVLTTSQRTQGYHFKFDVSVILRADAKTQAEVLSVYVNNGIMTPNEARRKLDLESYEHGDKLVMNGNYIPLESVGQQYGIGVQGD